MAHANLHVPTAPTGGSASMTTNASNDINKTHDGTRETGFPEPLSLQRNTTLPHQDAQTAPHEELDTSIITQKHRRHHRPHMRHHHHHDRDPEVDMYQGLEVQDNVDDERPRGGVVKRVLGRLSCGTI